MANRNRIDLEWIARNDYRNINGVAYKYVLHANGYEIEKYTNKADAIANAREIWTGGNGKVGTWVGGHGGDWDWKPVRNVEVVWIGNADTHAVFELGTRD